MRSKIAMIENGSDSDRTLRAAALVRMSTEVQQNSPERQRQAFAAYCERYGLVPVGEYDDLGVSATHTKAADRHGLQQLLVDARKGLFDLVFLEEISRSARKSEEFFPLRAELMRMGVALVTPHDDPRQQQGSAHHFAQGVMALAAELEAGQISERVRNTQQMMAAAGKYVGGRTPPGLRWNKAEQRWELDEAQAEMCQRVFALYLQFHNFEETARVLNEEGWTTTTGRPWAGGTVCKLLTNPCFRGRIQRNGQEYIVADMPTIVPPEMVRRVQASLEARQTRTKRCDMSDYAIFTGLLQCPGCGNWMTCSYSNTSRPHPTVVYYCWRARREPRTCPQERTVAQTRLERAVLPQIIAHLKELRAELADESPRRRGGRPVSWELRARRLGEERERILQQHQKGWLDDAETERRIRAVAERQAELARQQAADSGVVNEWTVRDLDALLPQIERRWSDWSVQRRRELLQALLDHIVPDCDDPANSTLIWKE